MSLTKELNLSVHDLVDFLLRTGDIDNRVYNQDTMTRGSEIHALYQKHKIGDYISEYYLKSTLEVDGFKVTIDGRADGIYTHKVPIIEEVKSTIDDLESFYKKNKDWHLGQAITYAYMYLEEKKLNECEIRLTYISQTKEEKKEYNFKYSFNELKKQVTKYIQEYIGFYTKIFDHKVSRNKSSEFLNFPFKSKRKGQDDFIRLVDQTINRGGVSFIEASTGIGKTMSALYPSVKSFGRTNVDKVFYLTAKNTGKDSAYQATSLLVNKGLDVGAIYITAKEKMCATPGAACNPDECPFARDYYTNLKQALMYAIDAHKLYNHEEIKRVADKFKICPFEFSLDLSLYMDIVIADYNYFFDPIVHLERYFDMDASQYIVLVDEAHNLVDRASEMYSESLDYYSFKRMKEDYRFVTDKAFKRAMTRVDKIFKEELMIDEYNKIIDDITHETYLGLTNLNDHIVDYLKENSFHPSEDSIDFSRRLNRFLKLYENYSDSDVLYLEKSIENNVALNLLCLDASKRLRDSFNSVHASILFSATLSPLDYYKQVLGGNELDSSLVLPSPFPKENFKLILASAKLKYKDRDGSLYQVIEYINNFIKAKKGNYLIYAPSFEYLNKLKAYFINNDEQEIIFQNKDMDDRDKQLFISRFLNKSDKSVIGFSVVGGAFAEGIDLVADHLIGVIVIGVGLPTISFKRNLIKDYYDNKDISGYSYAYKHPGMNKVSQAVGRLIRSESDIGAALLIDDRYLTNEYKRLFKKDWSDYEVAMNPKEISNILKKFYK